MTTSFADTAAPSVLYERAHWYACYTHGRHEKRVASRLEEAGVESYLPLRVERRCWTDRIREVELPMFPSYVFGRFRLGALSLVLNTPGISTVVSAGLGRHPTPIPDREIEHVRLAVELAQHHGVEPEIGPYIEEGTRVRVVAGVFRGVEGLALRGGRSQIRVGLRAIGQGLTLQIRREDIEPLDSCHAPKAPEAGRPFPVVPVRNDRALNQKRACPETCKRTCILKKALNIGSSNQRHGSH